MGLRTEFRAFVISQRVSTVEAKDIALALEADCRRSDFKARAEREVRRQQPQQQYSPPTAPRPPPPPVIAALPETTYPPLAAHAPTGQRRARGPQDRAILVDRWATIGTLARSSPETTHS